MIETTLVILAALLLVSAPSIIVRAGLIAGPLLIVIGLMVLGGIAEFAGLLS